MKSRNAIAFIVMVALIVVSLFMGAYKGWSADRDEVTSAETTLQDALKTRVETANNILTVARRHLSADDAGITALVKERDTLLRTGQTLATQSKASDAVSKSANVLLSTLAALDDVKADSRDNMYVTALLPQMLQSSEMLVADAEKAYLSLANDFNARFKANFISGFLSRLMGVSWAETYDAAAVGN